MAKDKESGEAVLAIAVMLPGLLLGLFRSYVRMRRHSKQARKGFYESLVRNGMPPHEANRLAEEYVEVTRLTFWIRKMLMQSATKGKYQISESYCKEK